MLAVTQKRETINQKNIQMHIAKNVLDTIILQSLTVQPTYGYDIMDKIKKAFGVTFGASTIYPLLKALENNGYVKSSWSMGEKPQNIYKITEEGKKFLNFNENAIAMIFPLLIQTAKRTTPRGIPQV